MSKTINGFTLVNDEKLTRAIEGTVAQEGKASGGLLEKYGVVEKIPELEILAAYDKLGGLILKNGNKVQTGSFYDFEMKKVKENPEITFIDRIDDVEVVLTEEEAKTIKKAKDKAEKLKAKAKTKKKK